MRRKSVLCGLALQFFCFLTYAVNAGAANVEWDGFVDGYYAYDFNEPANSDRNYTTSPARHNEFNINLAHIGATYQDEGVRGRLALQVGTSVEANYFSDPVRGEFSNSNMVKHLQEAYAGAQISENTWVDVGIFFSHIGLESFVSRDNMTYTRSLVADFSPFYQAGVRLQHKFSSKLSGELLVLNGWQIVTDENSDKALGAKLTYKFSDQTSIFYSNFVGREAEFRHFHNVVLQTELSSKWSLAAQVDVGFQKKASGDGDSNWYGGVLISSYALTDKLKLSNRFEFYSDEDQVIVNTGLPGGFEVWSTSLGLDRQVSERALWRTELRYFSARDEIYTDGSDQSDDSLLLVSSLAFTF